MPRESTQFYTIRVPQTRGTQFYKIIIPQTRGPLVDDRYIPVVMKAFQTVLKDSAPEDIASAKECISGMLDGEIKTGFLDLINRTVPLVVTRPEALPYFSAPPTIDEVSPVKATKQSGKTRVLQTTLNLTIPPVFEPHFHGIQEITIGDLHGNPLSLLHYLVKSGILKFTGKQDTYFLFKNLICKSTSDDKILTDSDQNQFKQLLGLFVPSDNKQSLVRLIGDIFVDRISNNAMMLDVLEHLHDHCISYEINFSNHDSYFVAEFCFGFHLLKSTRYSYLSQYQEYRSLIRLLNLLKSPQKRAAFEERIHRIYLPKLKLLSYYKNQDDQEFIFSHAILLNTIINAFMIKYAPEMRSTNNVILHTDSLEEKVNKINNTFRSMLKKLTPTEIKNPATNKLLADFLYLIRGDSETSDENIRKNPVYYCIWNRAEMFKEDLGMQQGKFDLSLLERAETGPMPSNITCIHGHTMDQVINTDGRTYITLDGVAGKTIEQFERFNPKVSQAKLFCAFKPGVMPPESGSRAHAQQHA